jgi:hypothetical protein
MQVLFDGTNEAKEKKRDGEKAKTQRQDVKKM